MDRPLKTDPTAHGAHAVGLHEWLSRRAARVPRQPALSCDDTRRDYAESTRCSWS
ncbi:hypothetical protein SAMN05444680_10799 [Variovorax sp. YR216]|nr:hypothetical protein SAMN05444680_10799 [Variovorax sp. YR216]